MEAIEWRFETGDHALEVDSIERAGDRIAVALSWTGRDGAPRHWAHVLTMRDGGIADMQDHRDAGSALRALRRSGR